MMVGLKKGGDGGVIRTLVIGLPLLFILIQTTTGETNPLKGNDKKRLTEVYDTVEKFCAVVDKEGRDDKAREWKFLREHNAREVVKPNEEARLGPAMCSCCIPSKDKGHLPMCKYTDLAQEIFLESADASGCRSGFGGFSEKVILITILVGKLFIF